MKTTALRTQDIEQKWYILDCTGKKLGRLSVQVANILRGKNKPEYTPNSDVGDFVILLNAKKIEVTGKKATDKIYYRHSGFLHWFSKLQDQHTHQNLLDLLDKFFQRFLQC